MNKFFTVLEKEAYAALPIMKNAVITNMTNYACEEIVKKLKERSIQHHVQDAKHESEVKHPTGYVTFFYAPNGVWMKLVH